MAARDSVSEGCYLLLPQMHHVSRVRGGRDGRRCGRGRKRVATSDKLDGLSKHGGFQPLFSTNESLSCLEQRRRACQQHVDELERRVEAILLETNQRALSRLITFLNSCYQPLGSAIKSERFSPYKEIPTGLLFAGVNVPDHDILFGQIAEKIRSETNHFLAVLQSKDCSSLKNLLKHMISQFTDTVVDGDAHNAEVWEENVSSYKGKGCAAAPYDMQILEGWYLSHGSSTSGEETGYSQNARNLVVMIQDFECFSSEVLEDFLTICSTYTDVLPIALLLGIATSFEALLQALPQSAISLLKTEKFSLSTADCVVDALTEEVLIQPRAGVKLSYDTFRLVLDNFLMHNKSLVGVVRCLKYAIMDFFYANPISILACFDENEERSIMRLLTDDHLEYLRMQKSFRSYIDQLIETDPEDARLLLTSNKHLVARLPSILDNLRLYHRRFAAGFDVLDTLQEEVCLAVNAMSFRKTRRDLYELALELPVADSTYFVDLMKLFNKLDVPSFGEVTLRCRDALSRFLDTSSGEISEDCTSGYGKFLLQLEVLQETAAALDMDTEVEEQPAEASSPQTMNRTQGSHHQNSAEDALEKPRTRLALRLSVAEKAKAEGEIAIRRRTKFTKFLKQAKDAWTEFFRSHMPHYASVALSELSFHHNPRLLSRTFCAQPRAAVQIALGQPHHYLACPCCTDGQGHLQPQLPDSTIAYRLYLEFGHMINMYDWFVAFGMVLERDGNRRKTELLGAGPAKKRKSTKNKGKVDDDQQQEMDDGEKFKQEVQARFIRAVSELHFLGFIKPTNRKTDHVVRCTWGDL